MLRIVTPTQRLIRWISLKLRMSDHHKALSRVIRQVTEWEKIFITCLFNRGLVYRMYKKNYYKVVRKNPLQK